MARAYGSSATLLLKRETAYGQAAAGDYNRKGFSLCFRSHQMLIGLLRSRHGSWTVPGDVRELLDLGK